MDINYTGQIGPTFFLLLIAAAAGLYVAIKYRTNDALREAADGWRENAEAGDSMNKRLEKEVDDLKLDLHHVRTELDDLRKRAPELSQLYELSNLNTTLNQRNTETMTAMASQLARVAEGVDRLFEHMAAQGVPTVRT